MTDRPIIFSAPMVRALLDGRKTQTRRLAWREMTERELAARPNMPRECEPTLETPWCRVKPGDRLWVRESFHATEGSSKPVTGGCAHLFGYMVPGQDREWIVPNIGRVREFADHLGGWGGRRSKNVPAIHMPRWASRLTLVVTEVRRQKLQEISAEDCLAEGIPPITDTAFWAPPIPKEPNLPAIYKGAFCKLWCDLHGSDAWEENPEVVAISFRCHLRNIDAMERAAG